ISALGSRCFPRGTTRWSFNRSGIAISYDPQLRIIDRLVEARRRRSPAIGKAQCDRIALVRAWRAAASHVLLALEHHAPGGIELVANGSEAGLQAVTVGQGHAVLERASQRHPDFGPPICWPAPEPAGLVRNAGVNWFATEVDGLHDMVPLLSESIINANTHTADVDVDARRLVLIDDADNPADNLHRIEMATFFDLGDGAALPPSNRGRVSPHAGRIHTNAQRTVRFDPLPASPPDELGTNEAVKARGDERLARR